MLKISNASVQDLVSSALGDDELTSLCQGHFNQVYETFTTGQDRPTRIRKLIDFAFRQRIPSKLLSEVRRINGNFYCEFASRLVENDVAEDQAASLVGALPVVATLAPLLGGLLLMELDIKKVFFQCLPEFSDEAFPSGNDPGLLLCACVNKLATLPAQHKDGVFPLLRFVDLLSEQIADVDLAKALRDWVKDACEQLAPDGAETGQYGMAQDKIANQPNPGETCRLVIHVEAVESGNYCVKAWVRGTSRDVCLIESTMLDDLDEFPALLTEFRFELASRNVARDDTEVEVFLPRQLISTAVDQWIIQDEADFDLTLPLGCDYPVVVRSLERARSPAARLELEARWRTLATGATCSVVCSCEEANADHHALLVGAEVRHLVRFRTDLRQAKCVVCAIIGHPLPETFDEKPNIFSALFAEGVPGAVWLRDHPRDNPDLVPSELKQLVADQPLVELSQRVKQRRLQAAGLEDPDAWHPGRHLALLWDDPTKPHPDYEPEAQLISPHSSRGPV